MPPSPWNAPDWSKGEPGTGKTELARQVSAALGLPMIEWHVKSTTKAQQGLYEYDAVARLRDSQLGDAKVNDVANYIRNAANCGRRLRQRAVLYC